MTLSKIKRANKKHKHERSRVVKRLASAERDRQAKLANKRMRAMAIQGRREQIVKRQSELDYVNNLGVEIENVS